MTTTTEEQNLKIVLDGLIDTCCNQRKFDQAPEYLHDKYVKHFHDGSPDCGRQEFVDGFKGFTVQFPNLKIKVNKSIAKGDEVWLWTTIQGLPESMYLEIVEICRIEDGKIIEKWDVHQHQPRSK